jgi:hypothetical protein
MAQISQRQLLQFSIMLKEMTDDDSRKYHRKKQLSLKVIGEIPQLESPTYEQKMWIIHKLKQPAIYWKRCC